MNVNVCVYDLYKQIDGWDIMVSVWYGVSALLLPPNDDDDIVCVF